MFLHQEVTMPTTTTGLRSVSLVCVTTRDQDRAVAFYESIGFDKRSDTPFGGGYRWIEMCLPGDSTAIALAPPPNDDPITPAQTGITLTTADIDAAHSDMAGKGVDVDESVSRMGDPIPPMFWFRDPSGHTLMVVEQPE